MHISLYTYSTFGYRGMELEQTTNQLWKEAETILGKLVIQSLPSTLTEVTTCSTEFGTSRKKSFRSQELQKSGNMPSGFPLTSTSWILQANSRYDLTHIFRFVQLTIFIIYFQPSYIQYISANIYNTLQSIKCFLQMDRLYQYVHYNYLLIQLYNSENKKIPDVSIRT